MHFYKKKNCSFRINNLWRTMFYADFRANYFQVNSLPQTPTHICHYEEGFYLKLNCFIQNTIEPNSAVLLLSRKLSIYLA